jgi:hypothetical protein
MAGYAEGILDRIMIDLEYIGKKERQTGKDLFHSEHKIEDVSKIKSVLNKTDLMVRVNSIHTNTHIEIEEVISKGADIIMLPYFKSYEEVEYFIKCVNKRAKVSLLIETKEALSFLNLLILNNDIDEYHIGLNDLSISLGNQTIFDSILDGTIENCISILKSSNKPYGFGGVGSLSNKNLTIDPLLCLSEQIRLGCSIGWLGRSFRNLIKDKDSLEQEINLLKNNIDILEKSDTVLLDNNHQKLLLQIDEQIHQLSKELKPYRI